MGQRQLADGMAGMSILSDRSFRLDFDPTTRTVLFRPIGHWSHEDVDRWETAIGCFIEQYVVTGTAKNLVVDLRERGPHSQDIAARVQSGVARFSQAFDRVAIVLPSSTIMGLQARRIAPQPSQPPPHARRFASDAFDAAVLWVAAREVPDSRCA